MQSDHAPTALERLLCRMGFHRWHYCGGAFRMCARRACCERQVLVFGKDNLSGYWRNLEDVKWEDVK